MIEDWVLDEEDESENDALAPFVAEGLITAVLGEVKSGKEGTVYCCRAGATVGFELLAAKVFRPRAQRSFKNDAVYREGIPILNGHDRRAVQKKTRWGRQFEFGSWLAHEFEVLSQLWDMGADVPKPVRIAGNALLMEYLGDGSGAAPALQQVKLAQSEARAVFERIMSNIKLFLRLNWVHGDLSAYNVLYFGGQPRIIDFPQAVDPRQNRNALDLLTRDIQNVCRYFERYGLRADATRLAQHIWGKFLRNEL